MHEQIAKVESAWLGYEDHGIFSLNVTFTYGSSTQGTGHYAVCSKDADKPWDAVGIRLVKAIIDACGVNEWSKVKGRTVMVLRDSDGWNAQIVGIRPLPTEGGTEVVFADLFASIADDKVAAMQEP